MLQVDRWRELVPESVAQNFVDMLPGIFPHPSATSRLTARFTRAAAPPAAAGDAISTLQGCAAILVGDAAHAFPPGTVVGQTIASLLKQYWNGPLCTACAHMPTSSHMNDNTVAEAV